MQMKEAPRRLVGCRPRGLPVDRAGRLKSLGECLPGKHRNDTLLDVRGCFMFYGSAKEFAKNCNQSQRKIADEKLDSRDNQEVIHEINGDHCPPHNFVSNNFYKGKTM